jgi:hypothetical protein
MTELSNEQTKFYTFLQRIRSKLRGQGVFNVHCPTKKENAMLW